MLSAAFIIIASAALLGTVLAVRHMSPKSAAAAPWQIAILHGLLGIGGLICLVWALRGGPTRGLDQGTSSFGLISATLIALAALIGGGIVALRLVGRRIPGTLVGVHATLAVSGFVILAAYVLVG